MVVTANQSVVDRGRLPTHDVPVLRKRRRHARDPWRPEQSRLAKGPSDDLVWQCDNQNKSLGERSASFKA